MQFLIVTNHWDNTMTWRFIQPNKPIRTNEGFLHEIDDRYTADTKLDGWRASIGKFDNKIHCISRVNKQLELPPELIAKFQKTLPEGMAIDAEWINKSRLKSINTSANVNLPILDCVVLFDITWLDGKCIASKPLSERREINFYKSLQTVDLDNLKNEMIYKMSTVSGSNSQSFYDDQKSQPLSEGIVVKKKSGTISDNWYKVKYRK